MEEERITFSLVSFSTKWLDKLLIVLATEEGGGGGCSCQSAVSGSHSVSSAKVANVYRPHLTDHYFLRLWPFEPPSASCTHAHSPQSSTEALTCLPFGPSVHLHQRVTVSLSGSWVGLELWSVAPAGSKCGGKQRYIDRRGRQQHLWQSPLTFGLRYPSMSWFTSGGKSSK